MENDHRQFLCIQLLRSQASKAGLLRTLRARVMFLAAAIHGACGVSLGAPNPRALLWRRAILVVTVVTYSRRVSRACRPRSVLCRSAVFSVAHIRPVWRACVASRSSRPPEPRTLGLSTVCASFASQMSGRPCRVIQGAGFSSVLVICASSYSGRSCQMLYRVLILCPCARVQSSGSGHTWPLRRVFKAC